MPDPYWRDEALCREVDLTIFFPQKGENSRPAESICARCEVRAECLAEALRARIKWGIWGGTTERERRKLGGEAA
jgi:WhiB family redox-sensing transcriptional regulator